MTRNKNSENLIYFTLITSIWAIIVAIVGISGEFPFGDDFAYAGPVKRFAETGILHTTDWSSMTLVLQILLGAAAVKIFGFSFALLRVISLLGGLSATIAVFCLLKHLKFAAPISFVVSVALCFNHAVVLHAFTFATDIPFLGIFMWCFLFYIRFLEEEKPRDFWLASLFMLLSLLIRELSAAVPIAFAFAYFLKKGLNKQSIKYAVYAIGSTLLVFIAYRLWFEFFHGRTELIDYTRKKFIDTLLTPDRFIIIYGKNIFFSSLYIGLSLLPVTILSLSDIFFGLNAKKKIKSVVFVLAFTAFAYIIAAVTPKLMDQTLQFLTSTLLSQRNLLPSSVPRTFDCFPSFSWVTSLPFFLFAAMGLAGYLMALYGRYKTFRFGDYKRIITIIFFFSTIIIYLVPILAQNLVSRYLLPILTLAALLILLPGINLKRTGKYVWFSSIVATLCILMISLTGTNDFMNLYRARLAGTDYLEKTLKIPPDNIDGGFEYGAWHFYDYHYKETPDKNWWYVRGDDYMVSEGRVKGYEIIREVPFSTLFPFGCQPKVHIMKRIGVK